MPIHVPGVSRREFLWSMAVAVPIVPLAPFARNDALPASLGLTGPLEPGQPLVVSGTIFRSDGRTTASDITLSVYHTDALGYYSRPVSDPRRARLRGRLRTGADGRYEVRTIKPGHYPNRTGPAHIHVHLEGDGLPVHWIDSFLFEGDPFLGEPDLAALREGGRFSHVMPVSHDARGVIRCRRDIRLDREIAERNQLVDGWYAR